MAISHLLRKKRWHFSFLLLFALLVPSWSFALKTFEKGTLIRDAEVETALKNIVSPLFIQAGLNPDLSKIYIIIDQDMNAAATVGYRIFIHSGIITKSQTIGQLAGVMAHETAHIASGHVMRRIGAMEKASLVRMAGYALGAAIAVASGRPEALMATLSGSDSLALGMLLTYTRGQESAADQGAVRYLKGLNWPIRDFQKMMETLQRQEYLSASRQDSYLRTHPLSQERVSFLKRMADEQNLPEDATFSPHLKNAFTMAKVKLIAYTQTPGKTYQDFPEKRDDSQALYARSIAQYREKKISLSLKNIMKLIERSPENPYFWEFLGQMHFEEGKVDEALKAYGKAHDLAPNQPMIRLAYGQCLLQKSDGPSLHKAQTLLEKVSQVEEDYPPVWHALAVAYGKQNQKVLASYALAKEALCMDQFDRALRYIERALKGKPPASLRQKLLDLKAFAQDQKKAQS